MKNLFEKYMFWVTSALMAFLYLIREYYFFTGTWTLNRTIGWGWEMHNYVSDCLYYSLPLFTIGYGILFFLKRRTVFRLSILHLFLIFIMTFFQLSTLAYSIILLNLSWLVFSLNIYKSKKMVF